VLEDDEQDANRVILLSSDAFPPSREVKVVPKTHAVLAEATSTATPDGVTDGNEPLPAAPELKRAGSKVVESA
jgi:hypothetical protein